MLDSEEIALIAAETAAGKNAADIQVLDVRDLLIITDYFVIASGNSDRQVKAIYEQIEEDLRAKGEKPIGIEGDREANWIVMDYAAVVVHIFQTEQREFYQLERLWRDAPRIDWEEASAERAN